MIRIVGYIFTIVFMILSISCNCISDSQIAKDIVVIKEDLPQKISHVTLVDIELNDKTIEVKLIHDYYEYVCINQGYLKRWLLFSFLPNVFFESNEIWISEIKDNGYDFNVIFCSSESSNRMSLNLGTQEILNSFEIIKNPRERTCMMLQLEADFFNAIPVPNQGSAKFKKITFEDNVYSYEYYLFDHNYNFLDINQRELLRGQLDSMLETSYVFSSNETVYKFLDELYKSKIILNYVYFSALGDSIQVTYTPTQIKDMLKRMEVSQ